MSYFHLLPATRSTLSVAPTWSADPCRPYITFSLLHYFVQLKQQLVEMFAAHDTAPDAFSLWLGCIHAYTCVFSRGPATGDIDVQTSSSSSSSSGPPPPPAPSFFSPTSAWPLTPVSKLHPSPAQLFYDLVEICTNHNLLAATTDAATLHISPHAADSVRCFAHCRRSSSDPVSTAASDFGTPSRDDTVANDDDDGAVAVVRDRLDLDDALEARQYSAIVYDPASNDRYTLSLAKVLLLVFRHQSRRGHLVVKLHHLFYKAAVELVYLLSSLYDKVYVVKPAVSHVATFERYLVCKQFRGAAPEYLDRSYTRVRAACGAADAAGACIHALLPRDVPYWFKNKIDDINIAIGHRQLEALDALVAMHKQHRQARMDARIKDNLQKCVAWCEKHKIPHHNRGPVTYPGTAAASATASATAEVKVDVEEEEEEEEKVTCTVSAAGAEPCFSETEPCADRRPRPAVWP